MLSALSVSSRHPIQVTVHVFLSRVNLSTVAETPS